jgi:hypothetical protein
LPWYARVFVVIIQGNHRRGFFSLIPLFGEILIALQPCSRAGCEVNALGRNWNVSGINQNHWDMIYKPINASSSLPIFHSAVEHWFFMKCNRFRILYDSIVNISWQTFRFPARQIISVLLQFLCKFSPNSHNEIYYEDQKIRVPDCLLANNDR